VRHGHPGRLPTGPRIAWLVGAMLAVVALGAACRERGGTTSGPVALASETDAEADERQLMAAVLEVRAAGTVAKVYLDGKYKGNTPVVLPWKVKSDASRTFRVSLRAEGFRSHDEYVKISPGDWRTVHVTMQREAPGRTVCIDPGHPSEINDGLSAVNGTTENHINWVVAVKLKQRLEDAGLKVVMTKPSEAEMVVNRRRAEIANAAGAAMMVRLHCDAGGGSGFALYYPDKPGRKGDDVGPSEAICQQSGRAARALHEGMKAHLTGSLRDNGVRTDSETYIGGKQGALTGSIYSKAPVVTVEMVFLTNTTDAAFIKGEAGQDKMAAGLADGILRFVK